MPNSIDLSKAWIIQVEKWSNCNGSVWTIAHIKMMRQLVFSYLSGNPQKLVTQIIGINRSTGLPKALSGFHPLLASGKRDNIRFVLTLLSISRLLPGMKQPDLSSITNPSKANQEFIQYLKGFMEQFLIDHNWDYEIPKFFRISWLRLSLKSGPNGSASRTALFDLASMPESLILTLKGLNIRPIIDDYEKLLSKSRVSFYHLVMKNWSKYTNLQKEINRENLTISNVFKRKPNLSPSWFEQFRSKLQPGLIRKLSIVNDPEAKARIIAIFDYWSQQWLNQIHEIHFDFLKRFSQDRTFTQDPIIGKPPLGHKYYSFDLSSATDRFPMALQVLMVEFMFGADIAQKWRSILVDYGFYVPWLSSVNSPVMVNYSTGQPMGAYSSWSTFTICHHFILYVIHKELKLSDNYYIILGDDIVIWHDQVATRYLEMMKELGVEISIPKSNISPHMYEFAKRVFINGQEVTGIQLAGFVNVIDKYHLVYQALFTLIYDRNYVTPDFLTIPMIMDKLHTTLGLQPKMVRNLSSRVNLLHAMKKFITFQDSNDLVNYLNKLYYFEGNTFRLPEIEFNNIIYLSMDKILSQINASYIKYGKDLLSKPSLIEQAAIGLGDHTDLYTSPIYYISKLPLMEGLKNNITLQNKAINMDSIRDLVKAIALPNGDIFDKRNSTLLANSEAKLAKIFLAEFKSQRIDNKHASMPQMIGMGSSVLGNAYADLNRPVSKTIGLGFDATPKTNKPTWNTPNWNPFESCNNDMMN